MHIAPIETRYKGYRFRSRLEARWAVFFDALKIQWEYEKQGFHLPSGDYLPDFWLPQVSMWAEVKAEPMTGIESRLCCELAAATGWPCLKLIGVPENKGYWAVYPLQEGYDESGLCPEPAGPMAWGYAVAVRELRFGGGARPAHLGNDDCAACVRHGRGGQGADRPAPVRCCLRVARRAGAGLRKPGARACAVGLDGGGDPGAAREASGGGRRCGAGGGGTGRGVVGACDYPGDWLSSARTQARRALAGLAKGAAA
jgi:hypothetical protein